jgi:uncharacterized membrane protein
VAKKLSGVRAFISFVSLFLILVIVDLFWTGVIASNFYTSELGSLVSSNYRIIPAVFAWLLLAFGIRRFAVEKSANPGEAVINGGLFGSVVYGVYNLVNYAVIASWSLKLLIADIVWGAVFCALLSLAGYFLKNKVFKA